MRLAHKTVRIVGHGMTPLGKRGESAGHLMQSALERALLSAGLSLRDLGGLVAVPSLSDPKFMQAHNLATRVGLLPGNTGRASVSVRTIDTGGAGPVSGLLEAARMVRSGCQAVAVVAGDAVASLDSADFLHRADVTCQSPTGNLPSPVIPNGYDRVARWMIDKGHVTREQLAMCSVLMSRQAARHPCALTRQPRTLEDVLAAPPVAPVTGLLECARRSDGGAAIIVSSSDYMDERLGHDELSAEHGIASRSLGPFAARGGVVVLSGGEASGPLYPPAVIDESMFSCEQAARAAFSEAQLKTDDIDWFGLYDCFPICFVRAVEACGLAPRGGGGAWVEAMHELTSSGTYTAADCPVNTHGGLTAFGAPWEVPAMYSIIEACEQLAGTAGPSRQVPGARRAFVYGNGGIFSHSAVAILASPVD